MSPLRWRLLAAAVLCAPAALAQPFVVDDAGIATPGGCQVEAWTDRDQRWVVPACTPFPSTEFTIELGFVREDHGSHAHTGFELVAETKYQLLADDPGTVGLAAVAGVGLHPGEASPLEEAYAFVPLTLRAPSDRLALHLYGGGVRDLADQATRALYGARLDLTLVGELGGYGEVYGEGDDLGYQLALRLAAVPDRLELIVGVGGALRGEAAATGLLMGLAWTPPEFFRPVRLRQGQP